MGSIWQIFNKNMAKDENEEWKKLEDTLKVEWDYLKKITKGMKSLGKCYGNLLGKLNDVMKDCKNTFELVSKKRKKGGEKNEGNFSKLNNAIEKCEIPMDAEKCRKMFSVLGAKQLLNISGWNDDLRWYCRKFRDLAEKLSGFTKGCEKNSENKYLKMCKNLNVTQQSVDSHWNARIIEYAKWWILAYIMSTGNGIKNNYDIDMRSEWEKAKNKITTCILAEGVRAMKENRGLRKGPSGLFSVLQTRAKLNSSNKGEITVVSALDDLIEAIAEPTLLSETVEKKMWSDVQDEGKMKELDLVKIGILFKDRGGLPYKVESIIGDQIGEIKKLGEEKLKQEYNKTCLGIDSLNEKNAKNI